MAIKCKEKVCVYIIAEMVGFWENAKTAILLTA